MRAIDNLDLFTNGVTITVEYDSKYYDKTMTCSNGITTYTATTTSSGSTTFLVMESGTWTITCDGDSTSITVTTSHTLSMVPDGKTVLPTDDIQTCLACAGITNKSYTTLAEVLADSTTLSALIASNNAVDYMVRSTTWAVPITVPIMTSNTTPEGVASCDKNFTQDPAWHAFDQNVATQWSTFGQTNPTTGKVRYQFINPVAITTVTALIPYDGGYRAKDYKVNASNDGVTYQTLASGTFTSKSETSTETITFQNTDKYLYWEMEIDSTYSGAVNIRILQFYSDSITTSATAMSYIGLNNYCANTLLADSTWCEAICNSEYFESVLNVKVPVMTSNTTPSGVVSASSNYTNTAPWKAFDGDNNTEWDPSSNASPSWLMYEFPTNTRIYLAWMRIREKKSGFTAYIQGSNDGLTWETLYTHPADTSSGGAYYEEWAVLSSVSDYKYYRWYTTRVAFIAGNFSANPRQMQFYGREDV